MPRSRNIETNIRSTLFWLNLLQTAALIVVGMGLNRMLPDCDCNESDGASMIGLAGFATIFLVMIDHCVKLDAATRASDALPDRIKIDPYFQVKFPPSTNTAIAERPSKRMRYNCLSISAIYLLQTAVIMLAGVGVGKQVPDCDCNAITGHNMIILAGLVNVVLAGVKYNVKEDAAERASHALPDGITIDSFYRLTIASPANADASADTHGEYTALNP
jgi:hypothetical protein